MKKCSTLSRLLAFALVLCLCAAFVPVMTFADETEQTDANETWSTYDPNEESSSEFTTDADGAWRITTAADLAAFAAKINGGYSFVGETVYLDTNIIWNEGNAADWAETPAQNSWTCGAWNYTFRGTFDGQGHVISGLYGSTSSYSAFLGVVYGAVVKNLSIVNSYFVSTSYQVGAVIGNVKGGTNTVENVYSDAIIAAAGEVGGLVGRCHDGAALTIKDSVFVGSATGTTKIGGILGSFQNANGTAVITDCLNLGTVTATASNGVAGGLFGGTAGKSLTIQNCINLGVVTGDISGEIYGSSTAATKTISGNLYDNTKSLSADDLSVADIKAMDAAALSKKGLTNWTTATVKGETVPVPASIVEIINDTPAADASVYDGSSVTEDWAMGEDGAWHITSAADLAAFAAKINGGYTFVGETVYLDTDIIWNEGNAADWAETPAKNSWVCCDWTHVFSGTFDGQGHVISGLYGSTNTYSSFVGVAVNAVIKNLSIVNTYFTSTSVQVGAVIGNVKGGTNTVENVYSDAIFSAAKGEVGGLVGRCHDGAVLTIKNSVFVGSATGTTKIGGVLGSFQNANGTAVITDCLNLGTVTATASNGVAGGLFGGTAGKSLTIQNCINLGTVAGDISGEIYGSSTAATKTVSGNLCDNTKGISGSDADNVPMAVADIKGMDVADLVEVGYTAWTTTEVNGEVLPVPAAVVKLLPGHKTQEISFDNENVKYVGRWVKESDRMVGYWSGTYLELNFTGSVLWVNLGEDANVAVVADGQNPLFVTSTDGVLYLSGSLDSSKEVHTVRIAIESDAVSCLDVRSIEIEESGELKAPEIKPLIEFVGDSITAGAFYDPASANTYAFAAAQVLNADYAPVSQGSIALYSTDVAPMSERYFWTAPLARSAASGTGTAWDFSTYTPDLIVINLGTNDHLRGNEDSVVTDTYVQFINDIREARGDETPIVMMIPLQGFKKDAIVAAYNELNDANVYLVDATSYLTYEDGDFYSNGNVHPSISGHQKFGTKLAADLRTVLLASALEEATNVQDGVEVLDAAAADVAVGTKFVTTADLTLLTDAIQTANNAKAETAALSDVLTAKSTLAQATATFTANIKTGEKLPAANVTLSATVNGKDADVQLILNGEVVDTVTSVDGVATFTTLTLEDGVYTYTVKQNATNGGGWFYDSNEYTITVTVADGVATIEGEAVFTNTDRVPFAEGEIVNGKYVVTETGKATEMGLIKIGDDYYYAGPNGVLVTGKYYAWRL
ncbi:MAG: hypothetical protein J6B86_02805, partial [Clostridia bacterium]|nr:hypothetical protein [Clostridia bacterium]